MNFNNTTSTRKFSYLWKKTGSFNFLTILDFNIYLYFGEYEVEIKAATVSCVLTILVCSTIFLGGIILYERFGEDSQKRSLLNMLASQYYFWNLCNIWWTVSVFAYVYVFGPLNNIFAAIFLYLWFCTVMIMFLVHVESLFIRYICHIVLKKFRSLRMPT